MPFSSIRNYILLRLNLDAHFNEHFMGIIGMHFKEVQEENLKGQELFLCLFNNPKQAK